MAHVVEIRNRKIVGNDDPADAYLPIGTSIDRPDGFYVSMGMDLEGPFVRQQEAVDRLDHLKRATRMTLEEEDRKKQQH